MTPRERPLRLDVIDRFRPRTDRAMLTRVVAATLDHQDRRDLEDMREHGS